MDQLPQFLAALVPVLAAVAGLEFRHRGRAKELLDDRRDAETRADAYGDRMATAEATNSRQGSLLRRTERWIIDAGLYDDPAVAPLRAAIEKETSRS